MSNISINSVSAEARELVQNVTEYLRPTQNPDGNWSVRRPNGRRTMGEIDVVFQASAKYTVLSLCDEVDRLTAERAAVEQKVTSRFTSAIDQLKNENKKEIEALEKQLEEAGKTAEDSEPEAGNEEKE